MSLEFMEQQLLLEQLIDRDKGGISTPWYMEDVKNQERIKHYFKREEREAKQHHDEQMYKWKRLDRMEELEERLEARKEELEARHAMAKDLQQEKHELNAQEFDRQQAMRQQVVALQEEAKLEGLTRQLDHTSGLSKQEHQQNLELERRRLRNEIAIRNGEHRAEQFFIQERYKGEMQLQEKRGEQLIKQTEIQAQWDYEQALDVEQERTSRELALAREQTERELKIAQENNNHALVMEKLKHLVFLEQKEQELEHYKAQVLADTEAHNHKEDQAMERRMREARHTFGLELQRILTEFLKMKLGNQLAMEKFTHEQRTLVMMDWIRKKLGLSEGELSQEQLSEMIADFQQYEEAYTQN